MEKQENPFENSRLSKLLTHAEFQRIMAHFLSPLELEAFKNGFQDFDYEIDGKRFTVGYGKALINMFGLKIEMFNDVLKQIDYCVLGDISKMVAFLSQDIKAANLPVYLANKLRTQGYQYMYEVYRAGKEKLRLTRGIGEKGLKTIEALMDEGGVGILFR